METKDRRVKREIANSNERRRMQSINAGFQKLRRLLPVTDGEKMSKAAILQRAAEFIQQIQREKYGKDVDNHNNGSKNNNIGAQVNDRNNYHEVVDQPQQQQQQQQITTTTIVTKSSKVDQQNQQHSQQQQPLATNLVSATKIDQQQNNSSNVNEIVSDRVTSPKNGLVSTGVAKAAIALPLEVPYTSETAIRVHHHHNLHVEGPRKLLKIEAAAVDLQDPASKGQNLDTICQAIMEIEGDRVFGKEETT